MNNGVQVQLSLSAVWGPTVTIQIKRLEDGWDVIISGPLYMYSALNFTGTLQANTASPIHQRHSLVTMDGWWPEYNSQVIDLIPGFSQT